MDTKLSFGMAKQIVRDADKGVAELAKLTNDLCNLYKGKNTSPKELANAEGLVDIFFGELEDTILFKCKKNAKFSPQTIYSYVQLRNIEGQVQFYSKVLGMTKKKFFFNERYIGVSILQHALQRIFERAKSNVDISIKNELSVLWIVSCLYILQFQGLQLTVPIIIPAADGLYLGKTIGIDHTFGSFVNTTFEKGKITNRDYDPPKGDILAGSDGIQIKTFVGQSQLTKDQLQFQKDFFALVEKHNEIILAISSVVSFSNMAVPNLLPSFGAFNFGEVEAIENFRKKLDKLKEEFSNFIMSDMAASLYEYGRAHLD